MTSRRRFLTTAAGAMAAPAFIRNLRAASPNGKLRHVSFGGTGMAAADLSSISSHPMVEVVAIAEVDQRKWPEIQKTYPKAKMYADWRELLAKEKDNFDSANVSTPDHLHACIGSAVVNAGKHIYGQKPLTQNLRECRHLTELVRSKGVMSQMGIQVSSDFTERWAQGLIKEGAIGKVKEVFSFSNKEWGDMAPMPDKKDPVPAGFDWNLWLGPAADRNYIEGYYHPGNWRKRRDFGTGTLGDMGCHMFSGWFRALDLTAPLTVKSTGPAPSKDNWAVNGRVEYVFPGTAYTADKTVKVTWTDGNGKVPAEVAAMLEGTNVPGQGSIFIGTDGVMLFPHGGRPMLFPQEKFKGRPYPKLTPRNHWHEFVESCLSGKEKPSANFDYAGPLTEAVLLGCLASAFPDKELVWDAAALKFKDNAEATALVRRSYRPGWEIPGME